MIDYILIFILVGAVIFLLHQYWDKVSGVLKWLLPVSLIVTIVGYLFNRNKGSGAKLEAAKEDYENLIEEHKEKIKEDEDELQQILDNLDKELKKNEEIDSNSISDDELIDDIMELVSTRDE